MARRELQQRLQIKLGEQSAVLLAHHNIIARILNQALGGSKDTGPPRPNDPNVKDVAAGHADVHAAVAAINKSFSI